VREPILRPSFGQDTTLDRAGLALATGGGLGGLVALLLVIAGGERNALTLAAALTLGTLITALAIVILAGPLWLALHRAGYRTAWHAAALGALLTMIVFVAGQTQGFGLFDAMAGNAQTLTLRWLSALATSALVATLSAGIAAVMWRTAYRPV
jgi:hypothetical protein